MKSIDVLDAIGEIDEKLINNAKAKKRPKAVFIASLAAVIVSVVMIFTAYFPFEKSSDNQYVTSSQYVTSGGEAAVLASDNIKIYYVENGEIKNETKLLDCSPEIIFNAWKTKNNIGDEVKIISSKVESNGTTSSYEFQGQTIMTHTVGDYFIHNFTVTKNLENYYSENKELLLETLEKTMTEYLEFNEFNLILE